MISLPEDIHMNGVRTCPVCQGEGLITVADYVRRCVTAT